MMNKETNANRYVKYLRKSQDREDRQMQSIPDQRRVLEPIVQERVLSIVTEFAEAKSAKIPGRPKFREMINMIERGEIDGIICWKLNRLARNPQEGGEIQQLLQDGRLKSIITPSREYLPTDNQLMMAVELGMANQYSLDLSQDVRRGLDQKAAKGIFPVGAKPGYYYDDNNAKGEKILLSDPERFPLIQRAMSLITSGRETPARVFELLNDEWGYRTPMHRTLGGKPMARSMFYKILSDTFYYGEFEYPLNSGNWYQGQHEPIVSKEDFEQLQIILGRRGRPRPSKHNFPFVGTMRCGECEASITAIEQWQVICTSCKYKFSSKNRTDCPKCQVDISDMDKPTVLHYTRYHCTKKKNPNCTQGSIETKELERQVDHLLSQIIISERFQQWAIKCLNEENNKEVVDRNSQIKSLQSAYDDCVKKIDNLTGLKISPQNSSGALLSDEEYLERKQVLIKEKADLERKINNAGVRINDWLEMTEKTFNFARYARHWFEHGTPKDRKAIIQALGLNLVLQDKELRVEPPSLLLLMREAAEVEPTILKEFELEFSATTTLVDTELEFLWDRSPSLSSG